MSEFFLENAGKIGTIGVLDAMKKWILNSFARQKIEHFDVEPRSKSQGFVPASFYEVGTDPRATQRVHQPGANRLIVVVAGCDVDIVPGPDPVVQVQGINKRMKPRAVRSRTLYIIGCNGIQREETQTEALVHWLECFLGVDRRPLELQQTGLNRTQRFPVIRCVWTAPYWIPRTCCRWVVPESQTGSCTRLGLPLLIHLSV